MSDVLDAHGSGRRLALTTSGTTTAPRTIVRTTESWWTSFDAYSELTGVEDRARVWIPGPLHATMNLYAAVHAEAVGAHVVSDPAAATHACLTPTTLDRRGGELPSGTTIVVAGGRLSSTAHARATALGHRVCSYYGAAELSFVAAGAHEDDLHPFAGVEVRIVDDVIHVASPYLAEGFGPWATVGDRGRLIDDRLVVLGRPGTATTAGATVDLATIEATLRTHASSEVIVLALPHPGLGEVVAAVCTGPDSTQALRECARTLLPASHRPRLWRHLDQLPLTPAGKIDRAALTEAFS